MYINDAAGIPVSSIIISSIPEHYYAAKILTERVLHLEKIIKVNREYAQRLRGLSPARQSAMAIIEKAQKEVENLKATMAVLKIKMQYV